ncbi:SpoIID/LytB domain-containing protein [Deinococcus sp. YIM 134068]|uniref:SpoIID/LytB domain-containing protein n=1 Tax=Deinococcus lichenicola TaxID=3118910 RepID=UPI002F952430
MRLLMLALALGSGAGALDVRVLVASGPQLAVRVPTAAPVPAVAAAPATPVTPAPLPPAPVPARPLGLGLTPTLPVPGFRVPLAPAPAAPVPLAPPPPVPPPAAPVPVNPVPVNNVWTVGARGANLTLNGVDAGSATLYLPPAPGNVVEIGGRAYRGGVLLRSERGTVQGINVVDVEDYLRGVVPAEMPPSWPAAALAAQAVIARTYVAARVNPALPYDTCATETCQVYRGVSAERPATDAAIRATAGEVVVYGGRPASTHFSSDSGGFTASSAEVWGRDLPYLTARPDPHSTGGPRARWRVEVGAVRVGEVAARYRVRVGTLTAVRVTRASESGRAQEVTFTGTGGTARLAGANAGAFIRALGGASSRATLSGPVGPGTPLVVEGFGAGHGVGLSQYGALGLARQGMNHPQILGFYYPGTSLGLLAGGGGGRPVLAGVRPLPTEKAWDEGLSALGWRFGSPLPASPTRGEGQHIIVASLWATSQTRADLTTPSPLFASTGSHAE